MRKFLLFFSIFNVCLSVKVTYLFAAASAVVDSSAMTVRLPKLLSDEELAKFEWLPMDSSLRSLDSSTPSPTVLEQVKIDLYVDQRFKSLKAKGQDLEKKFLDFEQRWKNFLSIDNVGRSSSFIRKIGEHSFKALTINEMFEIFKTELRALNTLKESYFQWIHNFFTQLKQKLPSLGKDFDRDIEALFTELATLRTSLRGMSTRLALLRPQFKHWEGYWQEQATRTFDSYNKSDELVSGYLYLQHPNMNYIAKPAQKLLLKQSLSVLDKWYINLATWMHHEMKALGVYKLIQSPVTISWSKPISLKNGETITFPIQVKHWNLIHTFLGEIKGGANFTGMHLNDDRLFKTFYSRGDAPNRVVLKVPDSKVKLYQKASTLFPANWNMYQCVEAAIYALQNIESIKAGDGQYSVDNLIIRGHVDFDVSGKIFPLPPVFIELAVNPATQEVISFYPIYWEKYKQELSASAVTTSAM